MTYFNPKIYCKQNLKEEDRARIERFKDEVEEIFNLALDDYEEELKGDSVDQIKLEVIKDFGETFKARVADRAQDYLIGVIENYDEVEEVDNPETFD